jgi:hypothetical protein
VNLLLFSVAVVALGGCASNDAFSRTDPTTVPSSTPPEPVTCEDGSQAQSFTFDEANAGSTSARSALEIALAGRASASAADFEGPESSGEFQVFTFATDHEVRVRVTVEDTGGSWRVERLEGCPPYLDEG